MKKILFVLIIVFLALTSYAHAFDGEVWIGQYSNQDYPANPDYASMAEYTAGIEVGHKFEYKDFGFRPYTKIDTLMDERNDGFRFHPAGVRYYYGATLSYKRVFVQYEHLCWHPVDNGGEVWKYDLVKIGATWGK